MMHATYPLTHAPSPAPRIEDRIPADRIAGRLESALHYLTWSFIRLGMIFRHRLVLEGLENLPRHGPVVLVANHGSHLDTLLIGAAVPSRLRSRLSPLAAGDTFFRSRVQSWLCSRFLNLRPLWRLGANGHQMLRLRHCLQQQDPCLLVFPEGTRSRDGSIAHFKPGVGMLVARTDIPVVPCHIRGTFDAWPANQRLPSKGTLHLQIGPARSFHDMPSTPDGWRTIAHELEQDIQTLAKVPPTTVHTMAAQAR
jgi:1-acyl-sn-glycerol-3-phosphate acyltransferase